jgi:hypothetical protein
MPSPSEASGPLLTPNAGEAAALLREALAVWRGVPFAEIDAPFARAAPARLSRAFRSRKAFL